MHNMLIEIVINDVELEGIQMYFTSEARLCCEHGFILTRSSLMPVELWSRGKCEAHIIYAIFLEISSRKSRLSQTPSLKTQGWTMGIEGWRCKVWKGILVELRSTTGRP